MIIIPSKLLALCLRSCRLKNQEDFDVDRTDATDIACFSMADDHIGSDGSRCAGSVRTLCQRSVNCASRRKMASSSSAESRDMSPHDASASLTYPSELHGRFRPISGAIGYPTSLSAPGGPAAAGYACMTLLSPERDCSPEPEIQPVGGGSSRNSCCGTGHYGCREPRPGSDRRYQSAASGEWPMPVPAHSSSAVIYTCSKHKNMTSVGGDTMMTTMSRGQPAQHRCKQHDGNAMKMAAEIGNVF